MNVIKAEEGKKIKLEACPFCGGSEYYIRTYMKGMVPTIFKFEDNSYGDNTDIYNQLFELYRSDFIYCNECNRRICKKTDLDTSNSPVNNPLGL